MKTKRSHGIQSVSRVRRLATVALGLALLTGAQLASAATITVDASKRTAGNPHFWSAAFGTGKAMLALRPDWQTHNKIGNRELGAQRVRGHGLFNSGEMDLWKSTGQYDWKNLDTYLLAITSANMRPIIELDFMPKGLSTTGNQTSPPKDYAEWKKFISAFAQHLVDKYTMDDVSKWYFEVWNEPDYPGFWDNSDMNEYYTLYDNTVDALTAVIPNVLVGGPATTNAGPIGAFLKHCKSANKRVTFASSHCYPGGSSTGTSADAAGLVSDNNSRVSAITGAGYTTADVKSFNTEWNSSYSGQGVGSGDAVVSMDNNWNVGFILKGAKLLSDQYKDNAPAIDVFSYWVLSDVFDEDGGTDGIHMTQTPNTPFGTIFGVMTFQGMRKAAFNAFKLLNYTEPNRLQSGGGTGGDGIDAMATLSDAGDSLQILVYNYYKTLNTASGSGDSVTINVSNLPTALAGKQVYVTQFVVDETHSNPYSVWTTQGKPANPTEDQWRAMHAAQHLALLQPVSQKTVDTSFSTTFNLAKQAGSLIIVSAKRPLTGRNSLVEIEGEDFDGQSGATKEASGDDTLGQSISMTASGYVYFENVDYTDDGVNSVQLRVKTASDTSIELRADAQDGKLLAKCSVTSTSNLWATQSCALSPSVTGVAKLYVVFGGVAHLNWLKFQGGSNLGSGGSGAGGSAAGGTSGGSAGGADGSANGGATGRGGAAGSGAGGAAGNGAGGAAGNASGGAAGNGNGGLVGNGGDSAGVSGGSAGSGNGGSGSGGTSGAGGSTKTRGSSGCSCRIGEKGRPSTALMIAGVIAAIVGRRRSQARRVHKRS